MDNTNDIPPSFLERFIAEQIRERGPLSLAEFMRLALYHPEAGYYLQNRKRIGTGPGRDFFTAYAAGDVFANLVTAAAANLAGPAEAKELTWVEIGAERNHSLWSAPPAPFGGLRSFGYGDTLTLPERAVVFSNELFDAQPFHRVRFRNGAWREAGVALDAAGRFVETPLREDTAAVAARRSRLPETAAEGAAIDLPLGAVSLLEKLVSQSWHGLFLAFDYGKSWAELCHEHPEGTLRAYSRHRQNPDPLLHPGERDLTGHICWDWMTETLAGHGFRDSEVVSQETFFVKNAAGAIESLIRRRPGLPDPDRQRLHQLIHPGHMGRKFQVLSAFRDR